MQKYGIFIITLILKTNDLQEKIWREKVASYSYLKLGVASIGRCSSAKFFCIF